MNLEKCFTRRCHLAKNFSNFDLARPLHQVFNEICVTGELINVVNKCHSCIPCTHVFIYMRVTRSYIHALILHVYIAMHASMHIYTPISTSVGIGTHLHTFTCERK